MCCTCCNGHTVPKTLTGTDYRGSFTLTPGANACGRQVALHCRYYGGAECTWTGCHVYTEPEAACPDPNDYAWHCCKKASCQVTVWYILSCSVHGESAGEYLTKPRWKLERQFVLCQYNQPPEVCPDYRVTGRLKCDSCVTVYDAMPWSCLVGDESSECVQGELDAVFDPTQEGIPWPPELMELITITS